MIKIKRILSYLDDLYDNPKCELEFTSPYELLIAVILSAQCTDKRVNQVTNTLFKLANNPEQMINLGEKRLSQIIYPCGFYNTKTKAIMQTSKDIIEKFNGEVPKDFDKLTTLSGVGRKTANVVISTAFKGQAIAVDTHVHRVSKRLSLTAPNSTPLQCEMDLLSIIPYNKRSKFHHQMVNFGRNECKAIKPKCEECKLKDICNYYKNNKKG